MNVKIIMITMETTRWMTTGVHISSWSVTAEVEAGVAVSMQAVPLLSSVQLAGTIVSVIFIQSDHRLAL